MKKTTILLFSAALALGFVSCTKEQKVEPINGGGDNPPTPTVPTYQEGVFAPIMKVVTINKDDGNTESWNWEGEQLKSVTSTESGTRRFTYQNGKLNSTTGSVLGVDGDVNFFYNGNELSRCTANNNGTEMALVTFSHANGRINGADIALDAEYISGMLDGFLLSGKNKHFDPKQLTLTEDDNCIHMDFTWNGDDVTSVVTTGLIPFDMTKEMYQSIRDYLPVSETILSLVDIYFLVNNALPMRISIADTIDYTYDNKINPFFCFFGDITPTNLSLHNVLTAINYGNVSISVVLSSNPMQIYTQPMDETETYTYQYNDRNYPTRVEGSDSYTIIYKQ